MTSCRWKARGAALEEVGGAGVGEAVRGVRGDQAADEAHQQVVPGHLTRQDLGQAVHGFALAAAELVEPGHTDEWRGPRQHLDQGIPQTREVGLRRTDCSFEDLGGGVGWGAGGSWGGVG